MCVRECVWGQTCEARYEEEEGEDDRRFVTYTSALSLEKREEKQSIKPVK